MKKVLFLVVMLLTVMGSIPVAAQERNDDIQLQINGKDVVSAHSPANIQSSVFVPLRTFFETINFSVVYNPDDKSVDAWSNKDPYKLRFSIDSNIVTVYSTYVGGSSKAIIISNKATMYNGSVYVPLRAFGELLGAGVFYEPSIRTVSMYATDADIKKNLETMVGKSEPTVTQQPTPTTVTRTPLTVKQIAKLMDRVGYVEAYDQYGKSFASGSGFVLNNGFFITNSHVAYNAAGIKVKIDGSEYDTHGWYWFNNSDTDVYGTFLSTSYSSDGRVTGTSPTKGLNYTTVLPEIGDTVYAIGSPLGLENTISEGIVSGIRNNNGQTLIQHTADTDHGSSGGVLLNEYGEVIGITSSGFDGTNLDFAIPMSYVQQEIDKLLSKH